MTATLTLDEAGRLILPVEAVQTLGMKPGEAVRVEVTSDRIELRKSEDEIPEAELMRTPEGVLVIKPTGAKVDIVGAIKADREERIRKLSRR